MKILFLDIDGVLNSEDYFIDKPDSVFASDPLDKRCILLLKKIIAQTDARIVLTSSWRNGWDQDPAKCQLEGELLNTTLSAFGLHIYDKTSSDLSGRPEQILAWLRKNRFPRNWKSLFSPVKYAILDDNDFGWSKYHMEDHVVLTDFSDGGLQEHHAKKIIAILNH